MGPILSYQDRVRFEDVDGGNIVYHAHYLNFCERARSQSLIDSGYSFSKMMQEGLGIVVAKADLKYIRPLQLEEVFHVYSEMASMKGAFLEMTQIISTQKLDLQPDLPSQLRSIPDLRFFATIKLAFVDLKTNRPTPPPERFMELWSTTS